MSRTRHQHAGAWLACCVRCGMTFRVPKRVASAASMCCIAPVRWRRVLS